MFDKEKIDIECPKCKKAQQETIATLTTVKEIVCRSCNSTISIEASGLKKGLRDADKAIDSFCKNISKTFEIKF